MLGGYMLFSIFGEVAIAMAFIVFLLGILSGIGMNLNQWMISNAAPSAPQFANGLFVGFPNFGTTLGTAFCGLFISELGTQYSVFGATIFVLASIGVVFTRGRRKDETVPTVNVTS